jgi:hypothetical protein
MTEPVFCGECKDHRYNEWGADSCRAKPPVAQNWLRKCADYQECQAKNAHNDCPDFEASWWTRVKRLLGGT